MRARRRRRPPSRLVADLFLCWAQDACDIKPEDHTQDSLENWDKENITALALEHGLTKEHIEKTFKGLFPKRKIAKELLPKLKPVEERVPCKGERGTSDKTCDELGEEMFRACLGADVHKVTDLLGWGVKAGWSNPRGNNCLLATAGDGGDTERGLAMGKLLMDNGADPNSAMDDPNDIDFGQWNPLHRAATNGHAKFVKMLVERGAELENGAGKEWRTPLMLAAKRGWPEVARVLIEAGVRCMWHPMIPACGRFHSRLIRALRRPILSTTPAMG